MKKNILIILLVLFSLIPMKGMTLPENRNSFYTIAAASSFKKNNAYRNDINTLPKEFITKFVIKNGLIFVNANLNGKEGLFLLDSGLGCGLLLNSDAKFIGNLNSSDTYITGMGGGKCKNIETSFIDSFEWKGITLFNTEVSAMSLSNIIKDDNFAGIIGYDLFKDYQLTFDYQHNILKAGTQKDIGKEARLNGKLISVIPFELKDHMPVFEMEIEGKKYKIGLDTGASVNVMNKKYFNDFKLSNIEEVSMKGFGGVSKVRRSNIKETKIGGLSYDNMTYNFEDTSLNTLNEQNNYGIDGLIGYEFLKQYITVVDFNSREIRIYDWMVYQF